MPIVGQSAGVKYLHISSSALVIGINVNPCGKVIGKIQTPEPQRTVYSMVVAINRCRWKTACNETVAKATGSNLLGIEMSNRN